MIDLSLPAHKLAPRLLGARLLRRTQDGVLEGVIVETEAYSQKDAASHSYRGVTPRNSVMFGPPGFAYVYFTYGMHYCFNIVCGPKGSGEAVLIRALKPLEEKEIMRQNRHLKNIDLNTLEGTRQLCNGPAKLCQALKIDKNLNGHNLQKPPLQLLSGQPIKNSQIVKTTRIGIANDTHRLWRFYIKDNPYISRR